MKGPNLRQHQQGSRRYRPPEGSLRTRTPTDGAYLSNHHVTTIPIAIMASAASIHAQAGIGRHAGPSKPPNARDYNRTLTPDLQEGPLQSLREP